MKDRNEEREKNHKSILICNVDITEIYIAYKKYVINGEAFLSELFELCDSMCSRWVKKYLSSKGCFNEDTMDEAIVWSHMGISNVVKKRKYSEDVDIHLLSKYLFGIYKTQAMRVVSEYYSDHNRVNRNSESIEHLSEQGLYIPSSTNGNESANSFKKNGKKYAGCSDFTEFLEEKYVYSKLLRTYIITAINSDVIPQKVLALLYSRIIPHLIGEIPDTKMVSVKYAVNLLNGKTIDECSRMAEKILSFYIGEPVIFGNNFKKQLYAECVVNNNILQIKDVLYTSAYSYDKIEKWDHAFHMYVIRETNKKLKKTDPIYYKTAKETVGNKKKYAAIFGNLAS